MTLGLDVPIKGMSAQEADLYRRITKLSKINAALMQRVERSMDQQANAFSLFHTAIALEAKIGIRTEELKAALSRLERANAELTLARDSAERADRSKTRFFTAVSHDLLQPLHAARLSISALTDGGPGVDALRIAGQIEHALTSVEEMLRTILDVSRLEAGILKPSPQPVSARALFQSLALDTQAVAQAKGLALTLRAPDIAVLSDPLMLRRILQNLLSNAVRYTDHGGVKLAGRRRGNSVHLEVWDTGPGIPPAEQARIFEEFQRGSAAEQPGASRAGFGLGLAIVQRMAEALGHPIDLCSRLGHGSRFSIKVPYAGPASAVEPEPKTAAVSHSYGLAAARVVVIDNDFAVLDAMRTLLDRWSCETRFASDIEDVEGIINEQGFRPDIVLADFHLERGECGLDAVAKLRAVTRDDLPALVVTADHSAAVAAAAAQAGCVLLCKPVRPAELRALMLHLLD
ncbi:MAG: ATP-binding response regulator [Hyphomicrobium sp.]